MVSSYTSRMEDAIWQDNFAPEECEDFHGVIEYLNSKDFRSFGDGLSALIYKKYPDKKDMPALDILKICCAERDIDIGEIGSVNTLKGWFYKQAEGPRKGDGERQRIFAIAFALGFSIEETRELFNKVHLDRAFNFRNPKECIYYHCLKNGLSYQNAQATIAQVAIVSEDAVDATQYTAVVSAAVDTADSAALIQYINSHPHNFSINIVSAKQQRERLVAQVFEDVRTECQYERFRDCALYRKINGTTSQELKNISVNEMLEHITGLNMDKSTGTSSVFKNKELPKYLKRLLPQAHMFSNARECTPDEMRRVIIFLYSYYFWCRMQYKGFQKGVSADDIGFDDYVEEMDNLLFSLGFGKLYPGNPHDWMYCYCTTAEYPLDTFRELLGEVLEYGE